MSRGSEDIGGDGSENKMLILQKEGARISLQMQRGRTASDRRQLARAGSEVALYCIVLHCIALYCTVLRCISHGTLTS